MSLPKKTAKPVRKLLEKVRKASSTGDLVETLGSGLVKLLDLSGVVIFLVDEEKEHLHGKPGSPEDAFPLTEKIRIGLDDTASAAVLSIQEKKPIIVQDAINDPRGKKWLVRLFKIKSYMAVPMLADEGPIGALILAEQRQERSFMDEEVDVAEAVAEAAAVTIAALRKRSAST